MLGVSAKNAWSNGGQWPQCQTQFDSVTAAEATRAMCWSSASELGRSLDADTIRKSARF